MTLPDMVLPRSAKQCPSLGGQRQCSGTSPWNLAASLGEMCLPRPTSQGLGLCPSAKVRDGSRQEGRLPLAVQPSL